MSGRGRSGGGRRLLGLLGAGLAAAAVARELRLPAGERTWHGTVAGVVPYDFRLPTAERVRERIWAPDDPRVLQPQVFGVGWTLNLGRLLRLWEQRAD